jgi:sulfur carrier protein
LKTTINGEPAEIEPGTTIAQIVSTRAQSDRGIAVARNGEVVPRSGWATQQVTAGDSIEILSAAAGG